MLLHSRTYRDKISLRATYRFLLTTISLDALLIVYVHMIRYICDFQLIYTFLFILLVKMKDYSTFAPEMADQSSSNILLLQEKASLVCMVN